MPVWPSSDKVAHFIRAGATGGGGCTAAAAAAILLRRFVPTCIKLLGVGVNSSQRTRPAQRPLAQR